MGSEFAGIKVTSIADKSAKKKQAKKLKRLSPRRHEGHEKIKLRVFVVNERLLIV
ncbi:MAG: hypothetical protein Q7U66_07740 [Methylobacter sp.]|nr:hypothetical protein [Methylobacter sp.]